MRNPLATVALTLALPMLLLGQSATPAVGADTPTPTEIFNKVLDTLHLPGIESISSMRIINERGQERAVTMATISRLEPDGTEKKLIRFLKPADIKGTGLLTFDRVNETDSMWLFVPGLRKSRRLVASEQGKSFFGSEFTYADITPPKPSDFTYKHLPTEKAEGVDCWVLEETPANDEIAEAVGYSKRIVWVGKDDWVIRKGIYYDVDGDLWREMSCPDVRLVEPATGKHRPFKMIMVNKQNDRRSEYTLNQFQLRPDAPEEYFTVRYLEKW